VKFKRDEIERNKKQAEDEKKRENDRRKLEALQKK
jgi:hypothetical protein